ncbi:hypothetical protein TrispH2_005546 [Trichoplax sp. H2]|nr:hypothetical protein TrispH2_005546 [Trichoplax sp. H2]|eukprot:RDD41154.1 hypothetical protein TrispH2_005546 [Trichoplax sp. H2]
MKRQEVRKYLKLINQSQDSKLAVKSSIGPTINTIEGSRSVANKIYDISNFGNKRPEHLISNTSKAIPKHQIVTDKNTIILQKDEEVQKELKQCDAFQLQVGNDAAVDAVNKRNFGKPFIQTKNQRGTPLFIADYCSYTNSQNSNDLNSPKLSINQELHDVNSKRKLLFTRTAVSKNSHRILMMPDRFPVKNPPSTNNLMLNRRKDIKNERPTTAIKLPWNIEDKIHICLEKKCDNILNRNRYISTIKSNNLRQNRKSDVRPDPIFPVISHLVTAKKHSRFICNRNSRQNNSCPNTRTSSYVPSASGGMFRLNPAPMTKELKEKILLEKELYEADFAKEIKIDTVLQVLDLSDSIKSSVKSRINKNRKKTFRQNVRFSQNMIEIFEYWPHSPILP